MSTVNKDERLAPTHAVDIGVVVCCALFLTLLGRVHVLPVVAWDSLMQKILRWPLLSLIYGHINPFHQQREFFFKMWLLLVFCKTVLLTLPVVWVLRKTFHRYWRDIAVWIACLCPFLLGADIGLGLVQIRGWTLASVIVLMGGVAAIYLLRTFAALSLSRSKRVVFSLPCWLFWLLWFHIMTELLLELIPLVALVLYCLAMRKCEATSTALSTA